MHAAAGDQPKLFVLLHNLQLAVHEVALHHLYMQLLHGQIQGPPVNFFSNFFLLPMTARVFCSDWKASDTSDPCADPEKAHILASLDAKATYSHAVKRLGL